MKKSQLTMLMIVGLVLFVLISLALYLSKTTLNKGNDIERTQTSTFEVQPIKEYVQNCIANAGSEALNLIGQQGGYIYTSQGGNLVDFSNSDEGIMFTKNGQYKVAYNILPPRSDVGLYFASEPKYPWVTFPYRTANSASEEFEGFFGIGRMPTITSYQGPDSIQTQLENYIEKSLTKCSLNSFTEQGYNILVEKPRASAIIGDKDVSVRVNYPIHIQGESKQSFDLEDFSQKFDLRLRSIYFFAKELINDDTNNVKFNIGSSENNRDGFTVNVIRNNFRNDDLVILTDTQSLLEGKPYQYIFSRKNRAPALYYIKDNSLSFAPDYEITEEDLSRGFQLRRAEDPDEDSLSFSVKILDQQASFPVVLTQDRIDFVIEVSDGQLKDYQAISVRQYLQ